MPLKFVKSAGYSTEEIVKVFEVLAGFTAGEIIWYCSGHCPFEDRVKELFLN